jgi:hypothetical protein
MFGMFKNKKADSVKALSENSFLGALSKDLHEAKEKADVISEESNDEYEAIFSDALLSINNFIASEGSDEESFRKATKSLIKASEMKPSKPESYYYLSCLFHILGENEMAMRYLKATEFIDPDFDGIIELKEDITKSFSIV